MDIRSATRQVEGAVRAYLAKDDEGFYLIPFEMQRPLILMGPPGIGKTAVVGQIAERLGINFVSYSITHHTRQSALGLPYIAEADYGGKTYRVSRYTMSEIVGAAYDAIEATGVREGILFLDEVNCVSETLAPAMLQFLQYKTFGQHRLPAGWVIICAGNPPEYNRAAREFDAATMDRLKRIDIEPDLDVWMDYAHANGVHPAITTYLESKPQNFYRVRAAASGSRIVTARGWEDLSRMLIAYAHEGIKADLDLISQYLQDREVAEDFSLYLELFERYRDDYKVADILAGTVPDDVLERAREARLDERVALVNLMLEALSSQTHDVWAHEQALRQARALLAGSKDELDAAADPAEVASGLAADADAAVEQERAKGSARNFKAQVATSKAALMDEVRSAVARWALEPAGSRSAATPFEAAKKPFNDAVKELGGEISSALASLDNALAFIDEAFGSDGKEALMLMGAMATDPLFVGFVSAHPSQAYLDHGKALMFHERGLDLLEQADELAGL